MKSPLPAANLIFVAQGNNPFDEWANIVDCGDPLLTFLDNTVALKQLEKAHKASLVWHCTTEAAVDDLEL